MATEAGKRHIYRTVGYGSSFGGNPLRQHIGLGKTQNIVEIEVSWPTSKLVQRFRNVAVDRAFHLREGTSALEPLHWKSFKLRRNPGEAMHHEP